MEAADHDAGDRWSAARLSLESSRARVFTDELRTAAAQSVWATDIDSAKGSSRRPEPFLSGFNAAVTTVLPDLY